MCGPFLHLPQYDVTGLQRCADGEEVALLAWPAQDRGVPDNAIASTTGRGQIRGDGVGQSVGEAVEVWVVRLIVESGDGNPRDRRRGNKPKTQCGEDESSARNGNQRTCQCKAVPRGGSWLAAADGRDELISAFGNSADEAWRIGGIAERGADLSDAEIQAAIEIHVCVVTPECLTQGLACDHVAGVRQEQAEHLRRLRLHTHRHSLAAKLASSGLEVEDAEADASFRGHEPSIMACVAQAGKPNEA